MKTKLIAGLMLALLNHACTRNASEGKVSIQVLSFVSKQPLALRPLAKSSALVRLAEDTTTATT